MFSHCFLLFALRDRGCVCVCAEYSMSALYNHRRTIIIKLKNWILLPGYNNWLQIKFICSQFNGIVYALYFTNSSIRTNMYGTSTARIFNEFMADGTHNQAITSAGAQTHHQRINIKCPVARVRSVTISTFQHFSRTSITIIESVRSTDRQWNNNENISIKFCRIFIVRLKAIKLNYNWTGLFE